MKVEIRLCYEDRRHAGAVAKAVSPDNVKAPLGLAIETMEEGCDVLTRMTSKGKLQTLMATIDDFLCCVSIAEKTFSAVKKYE
ncbi:MAG: hypothetical protein JSV58_02235 [Candidatus Bathyarchaeota archaeon]|nr:MAG: hypothetical protein JSV58_02235 [Candidatus Bathyarchaeota archaeon]